MMKFPIYGKIKAMFQSPPTSYSVTIAFNLKQNLAIRGAAPPADCQVPPWSMKPGCFKGDAVGQSGWWTLRCFFKLGIKSNPINLVGG